MNKGKLITNIVLTLVVIGMAYYLYTIIQEPIIFEKQKTARYEKTIQRLKDIRQAQLAYKDLKGSFAPNFNVLLNAIKNDSMPFIKAIGEAPDTLTEEEAVLRGLIVRDTTMVPLAAVAFPPEGKTIQEMLNNQQQLNEHTQKVKKFIETLPYIPDTQKKFDIDAGEIEKNKVKIPVFEVSAPEPVVLAGLNENYIDEGHRVRVGSMTEGTYTGNWE